MTFEEIFRELRKLTAAERSIIIQHLLELDRREDVQALHETATAPFEEKAQLEQIETQIKHLTHAQQETLSDWLENVLEDRLELTEEFKAEIEAGKKDIAEGRVRIRKP